MQAESKVVNIYTESNPNPNSLKFVVNFMLMPEGISRDYRSIDETNTAPLAAELFQFPFVKGVFYMSNFITVTKDEATDWYDVKGDIEKVIKDFLTAEKAILTEKEPTVESNQATDSDTDLEVKIKGILDEYIRPAVEMDGGAISFHSFDEGKVKVLLQGSCSGCPSSTITLKAGIENLLKRMVPEVLEVEAEGI